jgi:hypothetical protein
MQPINTKNSSCLHSWSNAGFLDVIEEVSQSPLKESYPEEAEDSELEVMSEIMSDFKLTDLILCKPHSLCLTLSMCHLSTNVNLDYMSKL